MPITITVPTPLDSIGPGIPVRLQSSFIGPMPSGSQWQVQISNDNEFTQVGYTHFLTFPIPSFDSFTPYKRLRTGEGWSLNTFYGWHAGQTVYVQALLQEPGPTTVDTGNITTTWDPTSGLGQLVSDVQGSFPAGLSSTLNAIKTDTDNINAQMAVPVTTASGTTNVNLRDLLAQHTLDALTLDNLTVAPTGDPVTADVSGGWIFGVIVRLTTIPYPYTPHTPDQDYYLETLAVLTIFRGTDKRLRVPIHTSNHMESPLPGYAIGGISDFTLGTLPPWSSIEVDFAPGVLGQVYLMKLP